MEKLERILAPTDFSECSKEAFEEAIFLAKRLNATVLLAHVMESLGYPIDFGHFDPLGYYELETNQALERMAHSGREKGVLIETHLLKGEPSAEILKAAQNLKCDLIVMGTHGRRGMAHLMMGSVAERIIRSSPVPVLTVRRPIEGVSSEGEMKAGNTETRQRGEILI